MRPPRGTSWKPRSARRCGATPRQSPACAATPPGSPPGGRLTAGRAHLARLSAARRARQVLRAAEDAASAAAIEHGASYPMLADAAGTARQTAWKLYRPRAIDP